MPIPVSWTENFKVASAASFLTNSVEITIAPLFVKNNANEKGKFLFIIISPAKYRSKWLCAALIVLFVHSSNLDFILRMHATNVKNDS
jgi:hypothetical protein